MISSTSLPKKWLTSSSRGTQSRKSNNIFKKVMLHVLPEIIDKFIISQNRKEKNKKRKKEHVPCGCAQFFISISEIKVIKNRQRPTFPGSFPPSIIGAKELNFCVRDGNRCSLPAIVTGFSFLLKVLCTFKTEYIISCIFKNHWSSVRPISIGQLNALLHLHLRPINVVVFHGSYLNGGNLILWGASHLDAFSAYPVRR